MTGTRELLLPVSQSRVVSQPDNASTTDSNFFDNVIDNPTGDYNRLSKAQTPEYVANRTIRAIEQGKHEVILSWSGWGLVVLDRWLPGLANRMVARFGK